MGVKPALPVAMIRCLLHSRTTVTTVHVDLTYTQNVQEKPEHLPQAIDSWERYVDDCFGLVKGDGSVVEELFKYTNNLTG